MPSVKSRQAPDVLIVGTADLNGQSEQADAQAVAIAVQVGGSIEEAQMRAAGTDEDGSTTRLPTRQVDETPGVQKLPRFGLTLTPDTPVTLPNTPGRVKINFSHAGSAGRIWIGVGEDEVPDPNEGGDFLDKRDVWSEWTDEVIQVMLTGTSTPQRLTGREWAA